MTWLFLTPRADRANREPEVTVAAAPIHVARVEVQVARVVGAAHAKRMRPVVAVVAHVAEIRIPAI
ncbi:MAG: hypothetical protein MJZ27_08365 [Bacteroidales bacterium]|nr:hypothetical protein [Bacteroidales bacterium]